VKTLLKLLAALTLLCGLSFAQKLPDAPQPQPEVKVTQPASFEPITSTPRSKKPLLLYIPVVGFTVGSDLADIRNSTAAYKLGYVEENQWLVGPRPSQAKLAARDSMVLGLCVAPSALFYALHKMPLFYGSLAAPIAFGVKHLQGAYAGYEDLR
jgi:hypothetical protein